MMIHSAIHPILSKTSLIILSILLITTTMGVTDSLASPDKQTISSTAMTTTTATTSNTISSSQRSCWLVVDFDGTCSIQDTTPLLPKLASLLQQQQQKQEQNGNNVNNNNSDDDKIIADEMKQRMETFLELEQEFFRLYEAAKDQMCHETMSLEEALHLLDEASNHVTDKVSLSGVLKGLCVSTDQIVKIIEEYDDVKHHVTLQPGCKEVITHAIHTKQWNLGILSINWCPSLIDAALVRPILQEQEKYQQQEQQFTTTSEGKENENEKDERKLQLSPLSPPPIWCNSVDETGTVSIQIPGALAKKQKITELKRKACLVGGNDDDDNDDSSSPAVVIYIGDSSTDLAALVEADIGILIGQSKSTIAIAKRWGVNVIPLSQRHEIMKTMIKGGETNDTISNNNNNYNGNNTIWTVDTWSEIREHLLEKDHLLS